MQRVTVELVDAAAYRLLRDLAAASLIRFVPEPSAEAVESGSSPAPTAGPRRTRPIGTLKGQILCPPDFDTMGQEEIIAMFEGQP